MGTSTVRSRRLAQAAFYNTTGVQVSGKVRYRWRIGGKIRFNGVSGFTPGDPSRSLNRVFECKDPETTRAGWTQILFKRMLSGPERPDFYLMFVVLTAESTPDDLTLSRLAGRPIRFRLSSVSENADQQEAMLLMPAILLGTRGTGSTFYAEPSTRAVLKIPPAFGWKGQAWQSKERPMRYEKEPWN